jgi:hypothetical protein
MFNIVKPASNNFFQYLHQNITLKITSIAH